MLLCFPPPPKDSAKGPTIWRSQAPLTSDPCLNQRSGMRSFSISLAVVGRGTTTDHYYYYHDNNIVQHVTKTLDGNKRGWMFLCFFLLFSKENLY